ncbi:MAG TPA: T9SS type A sorting domain-containing protein [Bacteroidia bacterium]|nr:T9SS type A sorting domain-containing protein [Bacteroidia bacterium]
MHVSSLTKYSGFCAPQADFNINAVCNQVDGIQYIITVDTLVDIAIYTSTNDTVELGDTLFLSPGNNNYSFSFINGPGNITFNLRAYGTPTTAGQTYQCNFSNLWMSNMMLCNEHLTFNMQSDCMVDAATNLNNYADATPLINFPSNNNQFQLQMYGLQNSSLIKLTDVTGKQIEINQNSIQSNLQIPCQNLNSGIYFLTLLQNNNTQSFKFVITK